MRTRRIAVLVIAVAVGMLVVAASVPAQAPPPLVRFAGVVPTTVGAVPGGTATLTFAVYTDQQGGTPLWSETQTVMLDAEGRYAVVLGATQPAGLPLELFTSGEARWLGVTVAQGAEASRVLLVSVPYALKAADATTVAGKPLSAFVLAGDRTGTGADGLTYMNTQALTKGLSASGGPVQTGSSGAPNYLGMFLANGTDLGNSVVYQNGTNIGVNTTTPLAGFHATSNVAPTAFFDVYSPVLTALPVVYRAARGTPSAPSAVQTGDILGGVAVRGFGSSVFSPSGRGQVAFLAAENWTDAAQGTALVVKTNPMGAAGAPLERLRVTPAGNVGIGTTTPGQLLSVAGTIESTAGGFKFPDGTTQATAAASSASSGNSAFGASSLASNTIGSWNSAFGVSSLTANTAGFSNSAFGWNSLTANTSGSWNSAVGVSSLAANTTGGSNTAVGVSSLTANTMGSFNSALGVWSLGTNTTGNNNSAVGANCLAVNSSGSGNSGFGHESLTLNTTGSENSAFGRASLFGNSAGSGNSAFGNMSLSGNTTGGYNTAVGYSAGASLTTGVANTFIGYAAGPDAGHAAISNATALGAYALVTQSNTLVLGGQGANAVKVGIGTSTPAQVLSVVGTIQSTTGGVMFPDGTTQTTAAVSGATIDAFGMLSLRNNTSGQWNGAFGDYALGANTTGSYNTAIGYSALASNSTSNGNTAVGYSALTANTTGYYNTVTGTSALFANTIGYYNAATGASALYANTTGYANTATGTDAMYSNRTGFWNTATGYQALYLNTAGTNNTAMGSQALYANTAGSANTASGVSALAANTTGSSNTASGYHALYANTTGGANTATGYSALNFNTTGYDNTATGVNALWANTAGYYNTATGESALAGNTTGYDDTATGESALVSNTTGAANTATGYQTLYSNSTGSNNTAIGADALLQSTTGSSNIAVGYDAGSNLTTGNNNIDIGHPGLTGDDSTIRIGTQGTQTQTFIAGIYGVTPPSGTGIVMYVDSTGQIGTTTSSRRFKDDIADMAGASRGLMQLRPVTFHYKSDQNPAGRTLQYGLIAEEVAEVYPGLVAHSKDGQVETVMYQFLPPMLLNEYQKQQRTIDTQRHAIETLQARVAAGDEQMRARDAQIRQLTEQLAALAQAVAALSDHRE